MEGKIKTHKVESFSDRYPISLETVAKHSNFKPELNFPDTSFTKSQVKSEMFCFTLSHQLQKKMN